MAFNGSGVYNLYSPGNPVVTGTTISSTWANNTLSDIATGLSTCVTKDAQTTTTGVIPFILGISTFGVNLHGITGSSQIGYTGTGTGVVATTVQARLRQTYSVKDYGATGDGVTDDTAAIQAAIDAVNTAGGGLLYFPEGTYISSAIELQSYVRLVGDGFKKTILQLKTGTTTDFVTLTDNNTDFFGIEDIYLKGNYDRDAGDSSTDPDQPTGINITRSANSTTYQGTGYGGPRIYFRNVLVQYFGGNGISFNDTNGSNTGFIGDQRLENVYVGFNQLYGIYSNKPTAIVDSVWIGVQSYWNKLEGFLCRAGATKFIACKAFWNGEEITSAPTRVPLTPTAAGWLIQDATQCEFIGCEAQDNGGDGFKTDTNTSAPTRIQFAACTGDTNLESQFNFNTGTRILATGTAVDRASLTASMVGITIGSAVQSFDGNFVEFGMDTQYVNNATVDTELQINGVNVTPLRVVSPAVMAVTGANVDTNNTTKLQHYGGYHYDNSDAQILALRIQSTSTENVVELGGGSSSFNAASELRFRTAADNSTVTGTIRASIDNAGNVAIGTAALATNATDGFLYIPSCAGTPTGVPTAKSGLVPLVVNSTNNKLYFYSTGAWRDAGP